MASATEVHERHFDASRRIESEADRQEIREQLERLLSSATFHSSKRLSAFLRYIVEETLDNGGGDLKERVIGVKVFGRSPDYDTGAEPVVRVSAGELRKRLAQYYYEAAHSAELRIELPTGSYHPVFHFPAPAAAELVEAETPIVEIQKLPVVLPARRFRFSRKIAGLAGLGVLAVAGAAAFAIYGMPGNAYDQFWGPVVEAEGPVLIYAGGNHPDNRMVVEDALALVDLTGDLRAKGKTYRILTEPDLTPETMKEGPSVLIGAFTNPISRRITEQLRYTFVMDRAANQAYIQDRQNPAHRDWVVPSLPYPQDDYTDYAIVSRVLDPVTDRDAVVSAGIHRRGTLAAAEFLSRPEELEAVTAHAPRDWRRKNMQAVLSVTVRNGKTESGRVIATYFW
ncbi:MAG TPA: hypothetical protein VHA14_18245 [Bryobacteraceae bacterium]|nr:hypothetical protein [Bryobacteraceae bacterium]